MVEDKLLIDDMSMSDLLAGLPEKVSSGTVVQARVLGKSPEGVLVDIGLKMEGLIPRSEFPDFENALPFKEGDHISVLVRHVEGPDAHSKVSWRAAREFAAWDKLVAAHQAATPIEGVVLRKVKGGYVMDIGIDAFLPGSQLDIRPARDVDAWLQKKLSVLITEMDKSKSNVVVSRRKLLERERLRVREVTLASLAEGQTISGTVTSTTNFGAFVDIGGIEGLLHISDMSWHRADKVDGLMKVGQVVQVKVLKYDAATQRISLGLKQLQPHPWEGVAARYPVGKIIEGQVTTMTTFGAFVEIEPGLEGLLHVSELSWKDRIAKPQDMLKPGQKVEVKILLVDPAKEKLSLSLKRVGASPWEIVKANHHVGSRIHGAVTHLTPFGAFVMLPEGIEGLIHISDLSWTQRVGHPSEILKVGQEVDVVIMDVKVDAEKIVLSLKHTQPDPLSAIRNGQALTGKVTKVGDGGVVIDLGSGIEGFVRSHEMAEDLDGDTHKLAVGEEVTGKVMRVDARERRVDLSIRRFDRDEERQMLKRYAGNNQEPLTLADVLVDNDPSEATQE
jgi:small subunit ribosomal protein S1